MSCFINSWLLIFLSQAEAAEVTRREEALRAATASGEAAAKVVLQQKSPREVERNAMLEWLQQSGFGKPKGKSSSKHSHSRLE